MAYGIGGQLEMQPHEASAQPRVSDTNTSRRLRPFGSAHSAIIGAGLTIKQRSLKNIERLSEASTLPPLKYYAGKTALVFSKRMRRAGIRDWGMTVLSLDC